MIRRLCCAAAFAALLCAGGARADYFYKTAAGACAKGESPLKRGSSAACEPGPGTGGQCSKGRKIEFYDRLNKSVCVDDPKGASAPAHGAPAPKPIQTKSGACHNNERLTTVGKHVFCEPVGRCGSLRHPVAAPVNGKKMCID